MAFPYLPGISMLNQQNIESKTAYTPPMNKPNNALTPKNCPNVVL